MRKAYIPPRLRSKVEETARYRCGYCLTSRDIIGQQMHIEHIIPKTAGGLSIEENLWLACPACNEFKGAQTHAIDPVTGRRVRLFNPRKQKWKRHFRWSADGTEIIGKTAVGRATVVALQMNHPVSIRTRQKWVLAGWWPPED
jgi:5-methylcytosine-specific restriction endonuclease McrA